VVLAHAKIVSRGVLVCLRQEPFQAVEMFDISSAAPVRVKVRKDGGEVKKRRELERD
jgi:hypothetical protein